MRTLFDAMQKVTNVHVDGVTQITSIADTTVVAFICGLVDEQPEVVLTVIVDSHTSNVVYCRKHQYDASMKLFLEGDLNNEDQYHEAEHAQPADKKFRWIP